jgi:hypothetical protein
MYAFPSASAITIFSFVNVQRNKIKYLTHLVCLLVGKGRTSCLPNGQH